MSTTLPPSAETTKAVTRRRSALARLMRDPQAAISGGILLAIIVLGLLAPLITQHGPNEARVDLMNAPSGTPGYLLGGDQAGRDIWSRLIHSINTSMLSAIIASTIAIAIGTACGLVGGYFNRLRGVTEWVFALIMTFPGMLVLILLLPVTGGDFRVTMAIFGVMISPGIYRIVRNLVMAVRSELYVDAARVAGVGDARILARHVFNAVRGPVIIAAAFMAGQAIAIQAGLAFLGIGAKETPSFGAMISEGFRNLYITPWQFLWPSIALGLITASLVLFGNSLRDALEGAREKPAKIRQRVNPYFEVHDAAEQGTAPLLEVTDLGIAYRTPTGEFREVVQGVDLRVESGETVGLVGESGSGKTQSAFAVLGVLPPEAVITRGSIRLDGRELIGRPERELRQVRGTQIAYIPQEPMSNLDPVYTIGFQLVEGIRATSGDSRRDARQRALELLDRVGIPDPLRTFDSYPHQISGGMAQRVLIAGAVASRPKLLIADEPTTALDVTVQAEILDLLRDLQEELGMGVLLVTHNFGVVADICTRIAVMRSGAIVEAGRTIDVFRNPQHDYTRSLLGAVLDDAPPAERPDVTEGARQ